MSFPNPIADLPLDFSSSIYLGHFHVGLAVELLVINTEDANEALQGL